MLGQFISPREDWTPADEMLYGVDDFFDIPEDEAERLRFEAIKYAFEYQYSNNAFYRNFCQAEGIAPDGIKEITDLVRIPKIPDTFFKDYPGTKPEEFYSWLRKTSPVSKSADRSKRWEYGRHQPPRSRSPNASYLRTKD